MAPTAWRPESTAREPLAPHAGAHDLTQLPALFHGEETVLYGDQAYWKAADRAAFEARGVRYRVKRRASTPRGLSERWRRINRARSRPRARREHPFQVVKRLYRMRRQLLPAGTRCVL